MWKGDRVAATVAAASIVAKVTRDRMMRELDERYPVYGFSRHKGYVTERAPAGAGGARAVTGAPPIVSVRARSSLQAGGGRIGDMSAEDLEKYEAEMELQLYREYRDVVGLFTHVVETERRFYLTNDVDLKVRGRGQWRGLLRSHHARRLGMGHVPPRAFRQERAGSDLQGRQHRGAGEE